MPKKNTSVITPEFIEEGFILKTLKFYAERTQILNKSNVSDESPEYYLTLHVTNPDVLEMAKLPGDTVYEVTVRPIE